MADAGRDARTVTPPWDGGNRRDASASVDASVSPDGSLDADACASNVVLVPWRWSQAGYVLPDGAVYLPKEVCGMWPDSIAFRVWLSREGGAPLELSVDCADGKLDLGAVPPGDYEVAVLNDDECTALGAGAIPVDSPFSSPPGGPLREPIPLTVAPCGESRVEFEISCIETGCDDACGGA